METRMPSFHGVPMAEEYVPSFNMGTSTSAAQIPLAILTVCVCVLAMTVKHHMCWRIGSAGNSRADPILTTVLTSDYDSLGHKHCPHKEPH